MSSSSNKKIIPIIIVAIISIGAFAIIFNSPPTQDQANEIKETSVSQIEEPIQEIEDVSEPESALTSKIESDQNQTNNVDKANVSAEMLDPIQETKETSEPESSLTSKIESDQNLSQLRAAIIDQLHDDIPNYEFQTNATRMLEDAGYQVDLYTTKDITVEFYKKLPSMNYNFILIRTHGGEGNPDEEYPTRLFTGEKYVKGKYTIEQLSGHVGYGFPFYDDDFNQFQDRGEDVYDYAFFTIGSKLVKEGMVGTFPDSIIIVGGCQSASSHDLMESLILRGADHVLGWDATIGTLDNDKAMTLLLEDILVNKVTLFDAVDKINNELIRDFDYVTVLKLFDAV